LEPIAPPLPRGYHEDTIAAIATPFGESGIGIVRISGPAAEAITSALFRPRKNPLPLASHRFTYGEIIDPEQGTPVDEVLVVFLKAPKTYTREDVVEIQCHGGHLILQKILDLVIKQGARMAEPGEFTRRAFLNGRIDLAQAEAVVDLIRAKTAASLEIANQQLRGRLSEELNLLRQALMEVLALIEAHIDFPEEEIDPISVGQVKRKLEAIAQGIDKMVATYEEGRIFREGVSCAIIGKTNVGKSSLLNILLREERAIVTPVPGTTRDVIEEGLNIRNIPIRLLDTAGLRETQDPVEIEGVKRTRLTISDSDFVILVVDGSAPLDQDDFEIFQEVKDKKKVVVINKNDLPLAIPVSSMREQFPLDPIAFISALKNQGIDELKEAVYELLIHRSFIKPAEYLIVANIRHKNILIKTKSYIINALDGLGRGISPEFIAFELRSALDTLGEIVGQTTPEEVLNLIFEQFCIGK
jgi:tRNA modification GTPase